MILRVSDIQRIVAEHYEIPARLMKDLPRSVCAPENRPRAVAMFLARRMTNKSHFNIAQMFGRHNHSTTWHAVKRIEKLCAGDKQFASEISDLAEKIKCGQLVDKSAAVACCAVSGAA